MSVERAGHGVGSAGPAPIRTHGLWIFGYGSLMWRPGFEHDRAVHARLTGFRRCFCIYSMHHRGTIHRPGLVLGLDRGGVCEGIAYHVPAPRVAETYAYLTVREQNSGVYREAFLPVTLIDRQQTPVTALAYLVERAHPNYAGTLPVAEQAHLIRGAQGISGANLDYLINTIAHLRELGIRERELERVAALAGHHLAHQRDAEAAANPRCRGVLHAVRRLPFEAPRLRQFQRKRFVHRLHMASLAV